MGRIKIISSGFILSSIIIILSFTFGHICQNFIGGKSGVCPLFVSYLTFFVGFFPFSERINYFLVITIFLIILTGIIASIISKIRKN